MLGIEVRRHQVADSLARWFEALSADAPDQELDDIIDEGHAVRRQSLGGERYGDYVKAFIAGLRDE